MAPADTLPRDAAPRQGTVVQSITLAEKTPVTTRTGQTWTWTELTRAPTNRGTTLATWRLTVAKGGETKPIEMARESGDVRRAEGILFGETYVIEAEAGGGSQVKISFLAGPARRLSDDDAVEVGRKRYQEEMDQAGEVDGWGEEGEGLFRVRFRPDVDGARTEVVVGLYSGVAVEVRKVKAVVPTEPPR